MPAFSNSSGLKSDVEKLRILDGLVWMVGQTIEIMKAAFSNLSQWRSMDRAVNLTEQRI